MNYIRHINHCQKNYHIIKTIVELSSRLSTKYNHNILLKREDLQKHDHLK